MAAMAFDEMGRPVVIIRDQDTKERLRGLDALKRNIASARAVADILRTSLGPRGMDKMLVDHDGGVTVTNDGATIVDKIEVSNEVAKLMVELSKSQDEEIGDGTTGVVVLAGALLSEAESLLDRGLHQLKVAEGFETACELAVLRLMEISEKIDVSLTTTSPTLLRTAESSLNSKVVNNVKGLLGQIVVDAVLSVADMERRDVNLDLIKVDSRVGASLADTRLIRGIILEKDFSHPQMPKELKDVKIAVITCPLEPPKPKTKHKVDITTPEEYQKLHQMEQEYFRDQVARLKACGATLVACQWGFDDEGNHLLLSNNLPAIRWVGGVELELLAIATKARIVPRFEELTPEKLGTAGSVSEVRFGTTKDPCMFIEGCPGTKSVTIFVRGGNQMILEEAKRSIHDALCVVRNMVRNPEIVFGGGSCEIAASIAVRNAADLVAGTEQFAIRAFAEALDTIPMQLAENSGLRPVESLAEARRAQVVNNSPHFGIDCMSMGDSNMKNQGVYECLISKIQQFRLATQVVKMILKVDDVIMNGQEQ